MKIAIKILVFAIIIGFESCLPNEGDTFRRLRTFYSEPYNLRARGCNVSIVYKELSMTIEHYNCSYHEVPIEIWYHEIQGIEIENDALSVKIYARGGIDIPISENKTSEYKINFKKNLLRIAKIKGADLIE